ncbi:hypothetical protein HOLleu_31846 [Holothuria leucospilota]|uniref:Uncharacterized protein n=1 Tax=Holothuria leucospilota TaxID=206669 RepID=A0A9Q1BGJ6_HOLLE|nr:hypothetical protein HOLleu_31846 [Holothuria leucospilota]
MLKYETLFIQREVQTYFSKSSTGNFKLQKRASGGFAPCTHIGALPLDCARDPNADVDPTPANSCFALMVQF